MTRRRLTPVKSANHLAVRALLQRCYGGLRVLEEEPIDVPGGGATRTLFIDFVLPDLMVAIEVHGRQHDQFVPHFHGSADGFRDQQVRDRMKQQAIKNAGYRLLVLREKELRKMTPIQFMKRVQKAQESGHGDVR